MARTKKPEEVTPEIVEEVIDTTEEVSPEEVDAVVDAIVAETIDSSERSDEYKRVAAVYEAFKIQSPEKWELEKETLLAKLELL